ncbi:MAG: hypothetical protein K0B81_00060 [Candidatus Cloacimonetes bacterium]|nr:hypothetical protein [Candidatus Cloacimonadota bacterium]
MSIEIREIKSQREVNQFVKLPAKLHKDHPNWVPPIHSEEKKLLDPKQNLSHSYCDTIFALAYEEDQIIGRIGGIINKRYNEKQNLINVRFTHLESPDRIEVTRALLNFIENWAKKKGMEKIIGPMGWTEEDPEGFMIEGFEHIPNLVTYQNFPYINYHLEQLGYSKEMDYVVYKIDLKNAMTDFYRKVYERVKQYKEVKLLEFQKRKALKRYIVPIFRLMNECFINIYGYSELDEEEMKHLAKRYIPVIDPRFVKIAVNNQGDVVGFIIGIPSLAKGLIKAKGRLFPFGFYHILSARRKAKKLDVYLGAIKESYRGKGVDILMGYHMLTSAIATGYEYIDSHHEMETNTKVRAEMERVGGQVYKRFRLYQKSLI